jgi:glycosyltransferase involved in cell wall biosynthesis
MENTKFTIIIPTRNRAETLYWTIKTCLEQDYDNYEIIVSDNNSLDNTKEVVLSFNSDKIKYYRIENTISMTQNFEYALSLVNEGYVSIIGSDDALMPNALYMADKLIKKHDLEAIIGRKDYFKWHNVSEENEKGIIRYEVNKKSQIIDSSKMLKVVLNETFDYSKLPSLYCIGFISINPIKRVKEKSNGLFFNSSIPDVYSAIILADEIPKYLFSNFSFFLSGISSQSNGFAFSDPKSNKSLADQFIKENNIPFHSSLVMSNSLPILLADSVFYAKENGFLKSINYNIEDLLKIAFKNAQWLKYETVYNQIIKDIFKIIEINNVKNKEIDLLIKNTHFKSGYLNEIKRFIFQNRKNQLLNFVFLKKDNSNVYEASILNYKANKNALLYNNIIILMFKYIKLKLGLYKIS